MTEAISNGDHAAKPPRLQYKVLAASDFSELGDRAVLEALRVCAAHIDPELHVITVGSESSSGIRLPGSETRHLPREEAEEVARARVAQIVDVYFAQGCSIDIEKVAVHLLVGSPEERILALAGALDADVIVLGTHERHGMGHILGSVAEHVVKHAPCGVFVIRPRDFLLGEKLPEVQPALQPGEHALLSSREMPTYHYVHRMNRESTRLVL
jgi:universal stress protein A